MDYVAVLKRGPNSAPNITFFCNLKNQRIYVENECKTYNSTLDAILVFFLSQTHVRLSEGCIFFIRFFPFEYLLRYVLTYKSVMYYNGPLKISNYVRFLNPFV